MPAGAARAALVSPELDASSLCDPLQLAGRARPGTCVRAPAPALTLMELMLVMVLLVIAGSLATPAINGAFSGVRLRRAGDAVIARWAEARAQAIESGAPYQFRFAADTGSYRVEPWTTAGAASATTGANGSVSQSTGAGRPDPATESTAPASKEPETAANRQSLDMTSTIESQLPESVTFQGGQAAVNDAVRDERRVDTLQQSGSGWSLPILFFPDGSSSQATVVLKNDGEQYLRVTLRGLTGVARASAVMTREEFDESSQTR